MSNREAQRARSCDWLALAALVTCSLVTVILTFAEPWSCLQLIVTALHGQPLSPDARTSLLAWFCFLVTVPVSLFWVVSGGGRLLASLEDWVRESLKALGREEQELWFYDKPVMESEASPDLIAFSEPFKEAFLDLTIGPERILEGIPRAEWPGLDSQQFVRAARPKLDELLSRLANLVNEARSATDELAKEPRVRQLLKDFEHELLELAQEQRIASAFARLPAPHGDWAARYRQMIESETRTSQHHGPDPSHN